MDAATRLALTSALMVGFCSRIAGAEPAPPNPPGSSTGPSAAPPPEADVSGAPGAEAVPSPPASPSASEVRPPTLRSRVEAAYPKAAVAARREGTVVLAVTVGVDGTVTGVEVTQSVSPELDAAASAAVVQWVFEPAQRNARPVAARISVAVPFVLPAAVNGPSADVAPAPAPPTAPPTVPDVRSPDAATGSGEGTSMATPNDVPARDVTPQASTDSAAQAAPQKREGDSASQATEVTVVGAVNPGQELRSASDFALKHDVLDAAPHHEGVDVLRAAPGLYIARPEGAAVAHRYMLRGFDSDHGQDIEFRVGGVPINLPSHIHGQGYADLGLMIGDAVSELRVTEGVHDPAQGDFAVAGSIDVRLGMKERGVKLRSGYGSFGTFQQLLAWAPPDALPDTFGAIDIQTSDGFGHNRAGERANVMLQQGFTLLDWRVRLLGIFHGARAQMAGVLRRDDIESGAVGFYDVYSYPTAQAQNALNLRGILGIFGQYQGLLGDTAELGLWTSSDRFRVQQNWTGFVERSQTLANVSGRGDLIEQRNRTESIGLTARYRTAAKELGPLHAHVATGASARLDDIGQQQNLLDAGVNNQTWDQRVDADIASTDIGAWLDLDLHWHDWMKLRLGYRADLLGYEVSDRLGNRAPATRDSDDFVVGYRRSAMGVAHGPRVSADFEPWSVFTIHASYGEGYRSPQARMLADGEPTPFSKVRSADLGVRWQALETTQVTVSVYDTRLSDDVAFDATEGRLERIGASSRRGGVVHVETRPGFGIVGAVSVTYVDAELLEPPPATAEEPNPPFKPGQNLPFVPPLVARVDLGEQRELGHWLTLPVRGKLGLGFSALTQRPLPYGYYGQSFGLLDGSLGVGLGPAELTFSVYNLLDAVYPASEYSFVSAWDPDAVPSRVPARHVVAGAPRTVLVSLEVNL